MPTGRHARDISAPADLSSHFESPTASTTATLEVQLATPTGRRPQLREKSPEMAAASVPAAQPAPVAATGTGRRRRVEPLESAVETPVVVATPVATAPVVAQAPLAPGTGRRRKIADATPATPAAALEAATQVEQRATIAPGTGRRRLVVTAQPVTVPGLVQVPAPDQAPLADVVSIEAGSRRRSTSRHRGKTNSSVPGNPALIAGAAAVAIAAVGAVATTAGGVQFGESGTELAGASTLAMAHLPKTQPADPNAARASRDKARDVLAARLQEQAKQSALAKALKLAQLRASRLAALAKDFFLPVHSYRLTAAFGEGGGLWSHGHTGQDFACPSGTPIHALASGVIISSGWDGPYGWKTVERLPDGTEIWYAHQSKILVHSGPVVAGQLIGLVGSTGNTTGPHLHLEVHPQGGPAVDPMPWLRAHGMHP